MPDRTMNADSPRDQVQFASLFGYTTLVRDKGVFVALEGKDRPPLTVGMDVRLRGDSRGHVPGGFSPGEQVQITGFCEPWSLGASDHTIEVSNGADRGWVKPSNILLQPLVDEMRRAAASAPDDAEAQIASIPPPPETGTHEPPHLELLAAGVECWNRWRRENATITPRLAGTDLRPFSLRGINLAGADLSGVEGYGVDLYQADLRGANLERAFLQQGRFSEADLRCADLQGASLSHAELQSANLIGAKLVNTNAMNADFTGADLRRADLTGAMITYARLFDCDFRHATLVNTNLMATLLIRVDLRGATLAGCYVHGTAAWKIQTDKHTKQTNLIVTDHSDPTVTTDNLDVAQLIHLLLRAAAIKDVIDSMTGNAVLLLGRFTPERISVLNAIADTLRRLGDVPIIFNFDKPEHRSISETVLILAGLSRFIIADLTNPQSSPYEARLTVPQLAVPFVPIIQVGEEPFAMADDLRDCDWMMDDFHYRDTAHLLEHLPELRQRAGAKRDAIDSRRRERGARRVGGGNRA